MDDRTLTSVIESFLHAANAEGYSPRDRSSLISPYFKNEFNLSAGHQYVIPVISADDRLTEPQRISINEPCLRRIDLHRIGYSPSHLLLFEMGVVAILGYTSARFNWLRDLLAFTLKWLGDLGLPTSDLIFTISGGARILGEDFPEDADSQNALESLAIPSENVLKTQGRRNYIYSQGENRPAGYSIEIFTHSGRRIIEIASLNIYTHVVKRGSLTETQNAAIGAGFGFERLSFVASSHASIFELEVFSPFLSLVRQFVGAGLGFRLCRDRIYMIAELLKSICFILADGQRPDGSGRGRILRSLARTLFSEISYLALPTDIVLKQGVLCFAESYSNRYPHILEAKDAILEVIGDLQRRQQELISDEH